MCGFTYERNCVTQWMEKNNGEKFAFRVGNELFGTRMSTKYIWIMDEGLTRVQAARIMAKFTSQKLSKRWILCFQDNTHVLVQCSSQNIFTCLLSFNFNRWKQLIEGAWNPQCLIFRSKKVEKWKVINCVWNNVIRSSKSISCQKWIKEISLKFFDSTNYCTLYPMP